MKTKIRELKQARANILDEAEAILNTADEESRALTAEEKTKYEDLLQRGENMKDDIENRERLTGARGELVPDAVQPGMDPTIGMSQRDVEQYSMVRAINGALGLADGNRRAVEEAGLELEASQAVADKLGYEPRNGNIFVPYDFMIGASVDLRKLNASDAEIRRLLMSDPTTGGYLVDTTNMTTSFINLLRNRLVLKAAGAEVWGGLEGIFEVPKQSGAASFFMVGEDEEMTESTPTVGQIRFAPKTGGGHMVSSRKLLRQSSMDIENWMRGEMATIIALGMENKAFHGAGTANEPMGLSNMDGIGSVAMGTNGGSPTNAKIVDFETQVANANADMGRMSYIFNSKTRGKLKTTAKETGHPEYLWDTRAGNTPVNGYGAHVTNTLPSNLTKGSGTGLSRGFFANWADVILAMWGVLEILVDPYTGSKSGNVKITGFQDFDVNLLHEGSLVMSDDIATA